MAASSLSLSAVQYTTSEGTYVRLEHVEVMSRAHVVLFVMLL